MLPMHSTTAQTRTQAPGSRSAKPPPSARRLVLVPAAAGGRGDELVRRYRLARLRLEPREKSGADRFAHLKHFHD